MHSEIFLNWLRYAIGRVGPGYYGYSERVYCYELYHFIRVAMHHSNIHREHPNIFLHSEIVKVVLGEQQARNIGVYPLQGQRSPDFILHEPDTAEHQIAAVEVKATPNVDYHGFIDDIKKLSELKESYNFELSIFHCINTGMDRLQQHLIRAIDEGIHFDREILLIAIPEHNSEANEITIERLLS